MKALYPIGAFLLLIVMILSLFSPHYETLTDGMHNDSFSYISQYPNPDQDGGFFGGGYYTTFNGFGSLNTIFNIILSFFTALLLLMPNLTRKMLILPTIALIVLFILTWLERIIAPYLLSDPDKLFSGFYVSRIAEIGIFALAFLKAKKKQAINKSVLELLDDSFN